ncbi:MAG: FAD-dependent monooxygenase [Dehalococcoidia bacterium]|nr:FAD-dependent monooxygenase [Dehalococcoidia bacterium]
MTNAYDAVVVGGGIAGSAIATVLARAGHSVLVLEKTHVYRDRVRGEWIAPWGVLETDRLGLRGVLDAAGAHYLKRHVAFGDDVEDPQVSIENALDVTSLLPGVPGPLCIQHTVACQALADAAVEAGVTFRRGIESVAVHPGASPSVTYLDGADERTATCRIIIGADGRAGVTLRQSGIELHADPQHHLFTGMLVEGAHGWPEDAQTKGVEGDINFLAFPQGNGRVRLYLGYASDRRGFLAGDGAQQRFLDAFRLRTVPWSEAFAHAKPAGPCYSYPNNDTWTDVPYVEGVVLVGDSAGHNDPIVGQGLSITLRDVRMVSDILLSTSDWSTANLAPYAEERRERLRRLRFAASITSTLDGEFGPEAQARRRRAAERRAADPSLMLPTLAVMVGPENVPEFAFEESMRARILE